MTYEIRPLADDDFFGWMPLFEAYCRFYESELDDTKALTVWTWLRDDLDPLQGVLAIDDEGRPIGLAHFRVVPDRCSQPGRSPSTTCSSSPSTGTRGPGGGSSSTCTPAPQNTAPVGCAGSPRPTTPRRSSSTT